MEFICYVLQNMKNSCLETSSRAHSSTEEHSTFVDGTFGYCMLSSITCLDCNTISQTSQYFMDFSLNIAQRNITSLSAAFSIMMNPERVDYNCGHCKKNVDATKQVAIQRLPVVACIQLLRFNSSRRSQRKIRKQICYGELFNFEAYVTNKEQSTMYKLSSVIVHIGTGVGSGHYVCYVRTSDCWFKMDDNLVYQVSIEEVLHSEAYVLFYTQIEDSSSVARISRTSQCKREQKSKAAAKDTENARISRTSQCKREQKSKAAAKDTENITGSSI